MRINLAEYPNGRADMIINRSRRLRGLSQHDLDDIAAFLAIRTARAATCPAEHGEHTCTLPPGHLIFAHQCRACPAQWPTAWPLLDTGLPR